jgi:hypothetical protein
VPLLASDVEELKSDWSLYAKTLGCQALTEMIGYYIKVAIKGL